MYGFFQIYRLTHQYGILHSPPIIVTKGSHAFPSNLTADE